MTIDTNNDAASTITRELVPDRQRADFVHGLFGIAFPMQLEPYVFNIADALSEQYKGAFWSFYALSGGGFYMAPDDDRDFNVRCENGYEGTMSADAFGITCCLYAFSHLSFTANGEIAKVYASSYHVLREFAMNHAEVAAIVAATD